MVADYSQIVHFDVFVLFSRRHPFGQRVRPETGLHRRHVSVYVYHDDQPRVLAGDHLQIVPLDLLSGERFRREGHLGNVVSTERERQTEHRLTVGHHKQEGSYTTCNPSGSTGNLWRKIP